MPRGGKRPGAGKPKGYKHAHTIERDAARKYLQSRVLAEITPIVDAYIEQARGAVYMFGQVNGFWVQITDPKAMLKCLESGKGFYRVTGQDPDAKVLLDVVHRVDGKPTEHVAVTGPDGGPVAVRFVDIDA